MSKPIYVHPVPIEGPGRDALLASGQQDAWQFLRETHRIQCAVEDVREVLRTPDRAGVMELLVFTFDETLSPRAAVIWMAANGWLDPRAMAKLICDLEEVHTS